MASINITTNEPQAGGAAMSLKAILFALGCLLAWFVLMPLLVVGGGVILLAYAIFAELGGFLTGTTSKTIDTTAARETARRMCGGYGVKRAIRDANPRRSISSAA
jgi:hypothetical protein